MKIRFTKLGAPFGCYLAVDVETGKHVGSVGRVTYSYWKGIDWAGHKHSGPTRDHVAGLLAAAAEKEKERRKRAARAFEGLPKRDGTVPDA